MFKKLSLVFACLLLFSVSPVMAQTSTTTIPFCEGNFDCDTDVDGSDASLFKSDFGRGDLKNPCPVVDNCPEPWAPCPEGMSECDSVCVDIKTDEDFCGSCETACTGGRVCVLGVCTDRFETCSGGLSPLGRWCDQGNGTVKDMTTGLVWLKKADWGGQHAFWVSVTHGLNAEGRASQLWDGSSYEGTAGLSDGSLEGDWRLPTKSELIGITNDQVDEYIRSDVNPKYFFDNVQDAHYWSGTTVTSSPGSAWEVGMTDGGVGSYNKDYNNPGCYVWPVRVW